MLCFSGREARGRTWSEQPTRGCRFGGLLPLSAGAKGQSARWGGLWPARRSDSLQLWCPDGEPRLEVEAAFDDSARWTTNVLCFNVLPVTRRAIPGTSNWMWSTPHVRRRRMMARGVGPPRMVRRPKDLRRNRISAKDIERVAERIGADMEHLKSSANLSNRIFRCKLKRRFPLCTYPTTARASP